MGLSEKLTELRWRAAGHYTNPLPQAFREPLRGAHGLEIGGPSAVFGASGLLPVYPLLDRLDGVQWATHTVWHELDREQGYRPEGARTGELYVFDGANLAGLADSTYDAVICSHVFEHFANPLRALASWRGVTHPSGYLLMVVPHMAGTFDHRRSLTTLRHMIDDFERGVGEDDLTHLEETLKLHDRGRDREPGDDEAWAAKRRENLTTRVLHHHTFTTASLLELLGYAGLELRAVETRFPHDIYMLARWPAEGQRPDNTAFLGGHRRSPFGVDRLTGHASSGA
ncbi:MAG TPA: methyltransferase domain-containing protein [Solirubrobacteraceae bacterium]|jgi:SAM-dependent methyltransferase|nr:methyltransferase domain-containing protein [Solirubrobacteraceae bacterium]